MGDFIYLRINKNKKQIEFHESFESARAKRGSVRKVSRGHRQEILRIIQEVVGFISETEIERWELPSWIKDWLKTRINKTVYITYVDDKIYYKFYDDLFITTIDKTLYIYDKDVYIYYLLLQIAEFHDIETMIVFSDLIDLLRINRLNYNKLNKRNLLIKIISYSELEQKMEGYRYGGQ